MFKTMELREGVGVFTSNGKHVGKVNRFILDPETNEVTHVVVQGSWLLSDDKVLPIKMVYSATDEKLILNMDTDDFNKLPPFEESHFVNIHNDDFQLEDSANTLSPAYFWYPPIIFPNSAAYGLPYSPWAPAHTETRRNIPDDAVPLKEGSNVISSDEKHMGDVERLFIDASSKKISHFLITKGLFFKERKLIPIHWVKYVGENKIHLLVSSKVLEILPDYTA